MKINNRNKDRTVRNPIKSEPLIMNESNELSLEQEFKLTKYKKQLQYLDSKESKKYLIATLKQMMIKDNLIRYFIQNSNL